MWFKIQARFSTENDSMASILLWVLLNFWKDYSIERLWTDTLGRFLCTLFLGLWANTFMCFLSLKSFSKELWKSFYIQTIVNCFCKWLSNYCWFTGKTIHFLKLQWVLYPIISLIFRFGQYANFSWKMKKLQRLNFEEFEDPSNLSSNYEIYVKLILIVHVTSFFKINKETLR